MISRIHSETPHSETPDADAAESRPRIILARYGSVPVVARFDADASAVERGRQVVVETDRGTELATVLETVPPHLQPPDQQPGKVLRVADEADRDRAAELLRKANDEFTVWQQRCADWKLALELIDIEWTLDDQLLLYVLNDRGPETTRLALLAAAGGHGVVHVQPVGPDGAVVPQSSGGGCGSGGCGCSA